MWRLFCAVGLALCLCAAPLAAQSEQLSPDEFRDRAGQALVAGRPDIAAAMAEGLRKRDGTDVGALLIGARAYRDLGQTDTARHWARAAWANADTPEERHAAALVMAQALASSDMRLPAQVWLRRAVEHAPTEEARAQAARDFRYVRARTPLSFQIIAGISPNSNINNGSSTGTSTFFDPFTRQFVKVDLRGAALALSGLEKNTGIALRYRFGETPNRATDLTLTYDYRTYTLTDTARTLAPGVSGRDFRTAVLSGGLTQRWRSADRKGEISVGAHLGTMTYGGAAYADFGSLNFGLTRNLSQTLRLNGQVKLEATRGARAPHADATRLGLALEQAVPGRGRLTWRLDLAQSRSDVSVADYGEVAVGLSYAPGKPLWGMDVDYGLRLRQRDFDTSPFSANGRQDRSAEAHLTVAFRQADFYGFIPTVTLRAERTLSNIGLYEADRTSVEFGVRSAF